MPGPFLFHVCVSSPSLTCVSCSQWNFFRHCQCSVDNNEIIKRDSEMVSILNKGNWKNEERSVNHNLCVFKSVENETRKFSANRLHHLHSPQKWMRMSDTFIFLSFEILSIVLVPYFSHFNRWILISSCFISRLYLFKIIWIFNSNI